MDELVELRVETSIITNSLENSCNIIIIILLRGIVPSSWHVYFPWEGRVYLGEEEIDWVSWGWLEGELGWDL